jgi:hypothetical protein
VWVQGKQQKEGKKEKHAMNKLFMIRNVKEG